MAHIKPERIPFAQFPAVRLMILLIIGIILGMVVDMEAYLAAGGAMFFCVALLYVLSERLQFNLMNHWWYCVTLGSYMLLIILSAAVGMGIQDKLSSPDEQILRFFKAFQWEKVTVYGQILNLKDLPDAHYMDMRTDSVKIGTHLALQGPVNMRIYLEESSAGQLNTGDYTGMRVTLYPGSSVRNPYQFDYDAYLQSQDIQLTAGLENIHFSRSVNTPSQLIWWQHRALELLNNNFPEPVRPLAKGILVGYKNDLSSDLRTAFSRSGLSHIIAVSGLHVGFLVAPMWFVIPWLWRVKYGKEAGFGGLMLLLGLYATVTGFSPSVLRASITAVLLVYGKLYSKVRDSVNLTAVAACILLILDPRQLFDVGFQLSFAAVFAILMLWPLTYRIFPGWVMDRWYGVPVQLFALSVIVQGALFPLLVYYFKEFSVIGPLINSAVPVLLAPLVQWGLICMILAGIVPEWSRLLNYPVDFGLRLLKELVEWVGELEGSWIAVTLQDPWFFLWWLILLFGVASISIPSLRWKLLVLLLLIGGLLQLGGLYRSWGEPQLEIVNFDVGQGDAALVTTPEKRSILIDTGRWDPEHNTAESTLLPYLAARNIDTLDAVVLTHPHADHIGGIETLIKRFPIARIYHTNQSYNSKLYNRYIHVAGQYEVPLKRVKPGDELSVDESVKIWLLGPQVTDHYIDINEQSIVLKMAYGDTEFLFMGDAGRKQEERVMDAFGRKVLDSDYLKVGHHGSKTSSSADFLQLVSPRISVVSVAWNNRYGHPHIQSTERLVSFSDTVLYTSLEGAVIFRSNGEEIRRIHWSE